MKQEIERSQQVEEELRAQYEFLKSTLDAFAYPFCVVNPESYIVEMANAAAYSGDLPGDITCHELLHGSERPCADDELPCPLQEIKKTKKPVVMEHKHVNEDGELKHVEVHGFPILDAEGNIIRMVEYCLDITKRKQFEEALRESETNWRSLIDTSPDHILMLDTDLNIQFANFASPGLTVEELIGTPLYTYVDEDRQDEVKAILEGVVKTGDPAQYETVYHSPDGSDIYYETYVTARRLAGSDEIVGLTLGARNISERVQIDLERQALTHTLSERVKELSSLYSISKLIMTPDISLDGILQGTVDLIPPSWQYPEITCARIILEGKEYRTENYEESPWKQTADISVHSEISGFVEVRYLEEKPEIDEGPFLQEERNLINVIAERLGSTTERLQSEQHILENELHLAALEERERIGRELHDDLGQMIGYIGTQTLAAQARLEKGEINEVQAILEQLIQITQDTHSDVRQYILGIRESSRISRVRTDETQTAPDFFDILEGYLDALHKRYGLETRVSLPDDWLESPLTPEVETQLLRIVQEALTNVSKHAGVDKAHLLFTQHAEGVQVIIADEGRGFEESRPFETSWREEDRFGLKIMRERAEAIGGDLEVRSTPGEGTSIVVHLPRALSQTQTAIGKGVRVLLVDDHPLYLEGLRSLLASRGFQVVGSAHDGLQAQSMALELRPDLILMDVSMPLCDGVEATKHIKEELPNTKVVMLTVATSGETLFEALKYGASGYLLKSLEGRQFFALLANVLDGETILSPELASMVLSEFARSGKEPSTKTDEVVTLTGRQNEVLELVAQGLSNKEIANKLHITEATVKYHVSQILERLHLKSRYQLAQYAHERGDFSTSDSE
ncbi:MAG: response regulator [Anaerolineales bacterium]|nr:response regulator [Anaerolineales bacterium]